MSYNENSETHKTRSSSKTSYGKKISDDDENYGNGSDSEITTMTSLSGIELGINTATAITKLPESLFDAPKAQIIDILSYRELNWIVSALSVRGQRNRTKDDLFNALINRIGDLWGELHAMASQIVKNHKPSSSRTQKSKATKTVSVQPSSYAPRTPFDPRLAEVLSDLYMSPASNWSDILITATSDESENYIKSLQSIIPDEQSQRQSPSARDNMLLQYIMGPYRLSTEYLNKFQSSISVYQKMADQHKDNEAENVADTKVPKNK